MSRETGQIKSVSWWHERLSDWLLTNPDKFIYEAAPVFAVSAQWLYIITSSDVFRSYHQARSREVTEKIQDSVSGLAEKTAALAELSIDIITDRLHKSRSVMPVSEVTDIADMAMKRLGMGGAKAPGAPAVNVTLNMVDAGTLAEARAKMVEAHGRPALDAAAQAPLLELTPTGERNGTAG